MSGLDAFEPRADDLQAGHLQLRRLALAQAMARFDWQFEHSDDAGHVRRCRQVLGELQHEAAQLDPGGAFWRAHAPASHHHLATQEG